MKRYFFIKGFILGKDEIFQKLHNGGPTAPCNGQLDKVVNSKKPMHPVRNISIFFLATCAFIGACKKHNTAQETTASLLQHKWDITSINGEVFRYVGTSQDYFDFENGTLIQSYNGHRDTLIYAIINNGTGIELKTDSNVAMYDLNIKVLTSNQLILGGPGTIPTIYILDSLYR